MFLFAGLNIYAGNNKPLHKIQGDGNGKVNGPSDDYKLFQNYPNPFNSISKIKYQILKTSDVQIKVFDIQGREISILVNRKQTPGDYECNFDASNMTSGIYFYQLTADGVMIATKKMIYLK